MALKSACKAAIILAALSFVLSVLGHISGAAMILCLQTSGSHNGWSMPHSPHLMTLLSQMLVFVWRLTPTVLLIAGFITLLSACLKRQSNPQANVKTRYIIAAVLTGLAALVISAQGINFAWMMLRHGFGLRLSWYLVTTLCALSLCIFAAVNVSKVKSPAPAITAIICHLLYVIITIAVAVNTVCQGRVLNNPHFSNLSKIFWFASFIFHQSGAFIWLAAVLLFLFAYLKNQPPQAGVIEPLPEPIPTLDAEVSPVGAKE